MPPPRKKRPALPAIKASPKIFLVHGQNEAVREKVARFIEKLGCNALILHELPSKGKTIFQKFSDYSAVEFAVVLLTEDDTGGRSGSKQQKRARQNVILELGFFLGKLGPEKVCSLYEESVELPSDYNGVVYIPLGKDEKWKTLLTRELKAAGIPIDSDRLLSA